MSDTAADKQRIEAFVGRAERLSLYRASDPTPTQLADSNDENFFSGLLKNSHRVLKQLLPDKTNRQYNLGFRSSQSDLIVKTGNRNFVVRLLFSDAY